jgi:hypothetical protein
MPAAPAAPPPTLVCPVAPTKPEVRRVPSARRWGDIDIDQTPRSWESWADDETPRTPQAA